MILSSWYTLFCIIPAYNVLELIGVVKIKGQKGWYVTFRIIYKEHFNCMCSLTLAVSFSLVLALVLSYHHIALGVKHV